MFWVIVTILTCVEGRLYSLTSGLEWNNGPIRWWEGGWAYEAGSYAMIRVTDRGITSYPQVGRITDNWIRMACNMTFDALCRGGVGAVFPVHLARKPGSQSELPVGWNDLGCAGGMDKIVVNEGVYDLSACDVFEKGVDIVLSHGVLYFRSNRLAIWIYWILVAISFVLVRGISFNIRVGLDSTSEVPSQHSVLFGSAVAVFLIVSQGTSCFVTDADLILYWITNVYVVVYLGLHVVRRLHRMHAHGPVYNVITGTLYLIIVRLYGGGQNPYTLVLAGGIGVRYWQKLFRDPMGSTILLDACYLSLMCASAVDWNPSWLIATVGASYVIASVA
jgi:hypothetical protein